MNELVTLSSGSLTMSSREIAELTGKRHGDIIRDIRVMLDGLGDDADLRHVRETKDSRGYTSMIELPKDLTITLVSGYFRPISPPSGQQAAPSPGPQSYRIAYPRAQRQHLGRPRSGGPWGRPGAAVPNLSRQSGARSSAPT